MGRSSTLLAAAVASVILPLFGPAFGPARIGLQAQSVDEMIEEAEAEQEEALYREARDALNESEYRRAARLFNQLRMEVPATRYAAESLYFQAFALSRTEAMDDLRVAQDLLDRLAEEYPGAASMADAEALSVRLQGQLARLGDADAYQAVAAAAAGPAVAAATAAAARAGIEPGPQSTQECGPDQEVRLMALSALQNMNSERAVPILLEVLQERDACSAELREHAVFLVSQHLTDETVDILVELAYANPDPDPDVREAAVFWLSEVGTEEAVDALIGILEESDDEDIQEQALFALSQHGDDRTLDVLYSYAEREDIDEDLREQAIFWLGQDPDGAERLVALYPTVTSVDAKEQILMSVGQQGDPESRAWLLERARDTDEPTDVREQAIFWLSQSSGSDGSEILALYRELDDPELKEQALFAISEIDSAEAVDILIEMARTETDPELREQAVFWLGQSDDPRAQDVLLELIRGGGGGQ